MVKIMIKIIVTAGALTVATLAVAQLPLPPKHELRAVWIATVDNIDFPSRKAMPADSQRLEFQAILDAHQRIGMNAVVVQIRPAADAFYQSDKEPWSEWLTGTQGNPPDPYYDPLVFMIDEAHRRNLEFHAWINPYRAVFDVDSSSIAPDHITRRKPEWFFQYGKKKYFNPGLPEVRDYITDVIADIAKRYDIDAVHFDDYFYPYLIANQPLNADSATFQAHSNGFRSIGDWRRHNIDLLIQAVQKKLAELKPYVKFGISPFAVWRNQRDDKDGSATDAGQPTYDYLYADVRKWLREGWIDYVAPQLYFPISFARVRYDVMLDWWSKNSYGRHLYIGQGAYRLGRDSVWKIPSEMPNQLRLNRANKKTNGSIYFSSKSLLKNPLGISDSLKKDFYKFPALVPPMRWKDHVPPNTPANISVTADKENGTIISWDKPSAAADGDTATYFAVYRFKATEKISINDARKMVAVQRGTTWRDTTAAGGTYNYVVTAFDRLHNESRPTKAVRVTIQ
jgi:uncharacterized lipoprotein YddW (UPF0748 family)